MRVHVYTLLFHTTGDDMPPTSADQMTFSPVSGSQESTRPVSRETPFCSGPRQVYQPGTRGVPAPAEVPEAAGAAAAAAGGAARAVSSGNCRPSTSRPSATRTGL